MNRDTLAALLLLAVCGALWVASFDIREPDYGQLSPAAWPRAVLTALTLLTLIYLLRSLRRGRAVTADAETTVGFFAYWRNVIWCFGLFLLYLLALPTLGMLLGGTLFVFLLLNALGGWAPRLLALHALIACVAVGGMWALFTYALGVLLPPGELLSRL